MPLSRQPSRTGSTTKGLNSSFNQSNSIGDAPQQNLASPPSSTSNATIPSQSQFQGQSHSYSHSQSSNSGFASSWVNRVRRSGANSSNRSSPTPPTGNRATSPTSTQFPSFYNQDFNSQQPISSSSSSTSSSRPPPFRSKRHSSDHNPSTTTTTTSPRPTLTSQFSHSSTINSHENQVSGMRSVGNQSGNSSAGVSSSASANAFHHSKNHLSMSTSGSGSGLSRFFSIRKRKDSSQGNVGSSSGSGKGLSSTTAASGWTSQNQSTSTSNRQFNSRRGSVPSAESPPLAVISGKSWGGGSRSEVVSPIPPSSSSKRASTGSSIRVDPKSLSSNPYEFNQSTAPKRRGSRTPLGSPNPTGEGTFSFPVRTIQAASEVPTKKVATTSVTHNSSSSPRSVASRTLSLSRAERDHSHQVPSNLASNPPSHTSRSSNINIPSSPNKSSRYHQASRSVPLAQISTFPKPPSTTSPTSSPKFSAGKSSSTLPLEMDEELRTRTISEGPKRRGSFKRSKSILGQLFGSQSGRSGSVKSGRSDEYRATSIGSKDDGTAVEVSH